MNQRPSHNRVFPMICFFVFIIQIGFARAHQNGIRTNLGSPQFMRRIFRFGLKHKSIIIRICQSKFDISKSKQYKSSFRIGSFIKCFLLTSGKTIKAVTRHDFQKFVFVFEMAIDSSMRNSRHIRYCAETDVLRFAFL